VFGRVFLLVVLLHIELVAEVVWDGEEALDPVEVLIVGDESVVILVDAFEHLEKDGVLELKFLRQTRPGLASS
jgi:hypothetical protein